MNIVHLFKDAAEAHPNTEAIIEKGASITYNQLLVDVQKSALYFKSKGIEKGDRVLVFVPMSIDLYRTVLALFYIGATAVFLDEWVNKKRLELCCQLADCKGFVAGRKVRVLSIFSKELRRVPVKLSLKTNHKGSVEPIPLEKSHPALITFTTGSTGTPKAALRSHGFLAEQFKALLHEIEPTPSDIDMPVLPIVLFVNLGVGCTSVIADFKMTKPDHIKPKRILQQIKENSVNRITASPFFIKSLAGYVLQGGETPTTLQKVFTGGAPVFPSEAQLYVEAFPRTNITIAYGSTEAEPISSIEADVLTSSEKLSSGLPVGKLYRDAEVRIIQITDEPIVANTREALKAITLTEGSVGEIIVSGPHVLASYFNNERAFERNKIVCDNKLWHRTGDSGRLVNEKLYLTGRCGQLIHQGEELISPFIVEAILSKIPEVSLGTVLKTNHRIVVVLESQQSISKKALSNRLSFTFDEVKTVSKIPRDPRHHSKIDYDLLKKQILK